MLLHDISLSAWCHISADLYLKHVNLLKTRHNLIYVRNQSVPSRPKPTKGCSTD